MLMKLKKLKMANVSKRSSGLGFDLLQGLSVGFGLASLLTSLGFLPLAADAQPAKKSDQKSGQNSNQNTGKLQSRQDQLQTYLDRSEERRVGKECRL